MRPDEYLTSGGEMVAACDAWPTARDFSLPEDELAEETRRFRLAAEQLMRRQDESDRSADRARDRSQDRSRERSRTPRASGARDEEEGGGVRPMQHRLRR